MRLTKDVRRQLLKKNEGFTKTSNYGAKNFSEHRTYAIRDGELHIVSKSQTSWADSRQSSEYVADEHETHRFLYDNLDLLNRDGVDEYRNPSMSGDMSNSDASDRSDRRDEFDAASSETDTGPNSSTAPAIATGAFIAGVATIVVWKRAIKPFIDKRRAARAARRAPGENSEMDTDPGPV